MERFSLVISSNSLAEIVLVGRVIVKHVTLFFSNLFMISFGQNLFHTMVRTLCDKLGWKLWRLEGEKPHDFSCFMAAKNSGWDGSFAPCCLLPSKSLALVVFWTNLFVFLLKLWTTIVYWIGANMIT